MKRTKPRNLAFKLSPREMRKLRREAAEYAPYIKPLLYELPLSTLIYHLPDHRERFYNQLIESR